MYVFTQGFVFRYAKYATYAIGSSSEKYKITIGAYTGDAGDSLSYHNNMAFSTIDQENDVHSSLNCAVEYKGAWWYKSCHQSQLTGE